MPNIKPVSDLRNYTEVLKDIAPGSPVYLTKNGRGRYIILEMEDYEKKEAAIRLMSELEKGRLSGEHATERSGVSSTKEGWLTLEETRAEFNV